MEDKPNIVLITTDTQRWDTLKCMGNEHAISPNLDKLASEGVLFTNAHTSSPVCSPTRCSLLTGLHTPIHGCIENGINRRTDVEVFPDYLKKQGYTNIMVGKTHFGPVPDSFDIQYVLHGEKSSNSDDFYGQHLKEHGFERASSHPNPIPEELFMDAFLVDTTIEQIDKVLAEKKGPFFAFCSMPSPHGPIDPPGKWANIYDGVPLPDINYVEGEIENHPLHLRRLVGTLDIKGKVQEKANNCQTKSEMFREAVGNIYSDSYKEKIDEYRRRYYGLAAYCDAQVGRLMEYLDKKGLRDNTLVIFTSDHGQQYFDHGFNDKHNYYDSSWRIPFIMRMPGTIPEGEERDFAIWNDITATILAAAGTEMNFCQGFDLFTPLKNNDNSPRKYAVGTLYKSAALATKKWKLEYYFEEAEGRLFDKLNDPLEQKDLYNNEEYKGVRNNLLQALLTWRANICDVEKIIKNTGGGGPVARRIARHTKQMMGRDAEEQLNRLIEGIDDK